jgi:hypothetical protein
MQNFIILTGCRDEKVALKVSNITSIMEDTKNEDYATEIRYTEDEAHTCIWHVKESLDDIINIMG